MVVLKCNLCALVGPAHSAAPKGQTMGGQNKDRESQRDGPVRTFEIVSEGDIFFIAFGY